MSTMGSTTASTPASTAEAAKGAASDVAGEAASAAVDVKDSVKTEVSSVVGEAADRAGEVLRSSQQELRTQVEATAKTLSSTLDTAARQLGSMADAADDPDSAVAQLSRAAADQLRQRGQRLEEGGLEGLLDDAKRFARNRPGAFMLGTIAAGFAVGRLAKHANLEQAVDVAKQELTSGNAGDAGGAHLATGAGTQNPPTAAITVDVTEPAPPTVTPAPASVGGFGGQR